MHRIERTPVIPINSCEHWAEYAELPDLQRLEEIPWWDRVTAWIQRGGPKKAEQAILIAGIAVSMWITFLGVGR